VAVTKALGAEELAVAGAAVDVAIGSIAGQDRVQWPVAVGADVALLVPHLALGQLLLGGEYGSSAPGTAFAVTGLN